MKDIQAIKGRHYIHSLVEQGEHVNQDFKYVINDARKIARSVSAFANNSGGRLLIGVKDNGVIAGVRNDEDIYVVEQAALVYCKPACHVKFTAYKVDPGVVVISAGIEASDRRPVMVDEGGGVMRAYFRVADENIVAHPLMVAAWNMRRDMDTNPLFYTADDDSQAILDALGDNLLDVGTLARLVHLSQARLNETLTRLAALGLVTFSFDGTAFRLTRAR